MATRALCCLQQRFLVCRLEKEMSDSVRFGSVTTLRIDISI